MTPPYPFTDRPLPCKSRRTVHSNSISEFTVPLCLYPAPVTMSSVANSLFSRTQTSTIVSGSRKGGRSCDDTIRREKCLWFEKKLKLKDYLRDKKNEERADCGDRFIRVNSKTLLTSYQIPAEDCYAFLKRLHRTLTPGLEVKALRKSAPDRECNEREEKDQRVLYDWISCSDLTAQVVPRFPTVLWFDLECMVCKSSGNGQTNKRHFKSKVIIETVISTVLENTGVYASVEEKCDQLYVTRGKTCGMHMFFPQVTIQTEYDGQELWTAVNKRLSVDKHRSATIDTGCSSMPLPMARNHNGLTRVKFDRDERSGEITIHSYQVSVPSVNELIRFTNFSHLVAANASPPLSTVDSDSGSVKTRLLKVPVRGESVTSVSADLKDEEAIRTTISETTTRADDGVNVGMSNVTNDKDSTYPEQDSSSTEMIDTIPSIHEDNVAFKPTGTGEDDRSHQPEDNETAVSDNASTTADLQNKDVTTTTNDINDCDDRTSNVSSSSSKRLVQTDIRNMCAKARDKRKRFSSVTEGGQLQKRQRTSVVSTHEPIVIDDDEEEIQTCHTKQRCDAGENLSRASSLHGKTSSSSSKSAKSTASVSRPEVANDDAASSFLCGGYVPSIRYSEKGDAESALSSHSESVRPEKQRIGDSCPPVDNGRIFSVTTPSLGTPLDDHRSAGNVSDDQPFLSTISDTHLSTSNAEPRKDGGGRLPALYVTDDSIPPDARLPDLLFRHGRRDTGTSIKANHLRNIAQVKETFEQNMRLDLDSYDSQTHETDMQLIVSGFNTEMDFYASLVSESRPLECGEGEYEGLRTRRGCSLHKGRENCPNAIFPEHVPYVLCTEDFVTEAEWVTVLVRYFDEYLNNAPVLHVMSHVLWRDQNVKKKLNEKSKILIERSVNNCLARFKMDAIRFQNRMDTEQQTTVFNTPKHPYDEKCTVVIGLLAICSYAYNIITPVFTDLAKICRLLVGNSQQILELLNSSTMSTATVDSNDCAYGTVEEDVGSLFDESVSRVGDRLTDTKENGKEETSLRNRANNTQTGDSVSAQIGNYHSVIASVLRWNYPALADQTLWGLFFYYYHVHADGLSRIMDEVVHGGLMVTALLQAYIEDFANNSPVDVRMVCSQTYAIYDRLKDRSGEKDRSLMPPPNRRGAKKRKPGDGHEAGDDSRVTTAHDEKRQRFEMRPENSKKAQRKFQNTKNGRRQNNGDDDDEEVEKGNSEKSEGGVSCSDGYLTSFDEVMSMIIQRYLRPVSFDETTVVYTEAGYEQNQNELVSYFSGSKELKRTATDVFTRSTLKYSMPHGDLLMYNTDVMGTVHRRSSCTNNLVLNVFENMYGGCMSYLTRRFNNHLKIFNRFNGDAYRLVVECRHAMSELVRSIELSYLNLILRQPIVPPVLETDMTVRRMYMSEEEILKGAFVCLNAMDYVRSINMFTRHSKFSQENCKITESFLDQLIVDRDILYGGIDEDARMSFRTMYLFFQLYIFEVLYKIRHAYNRDGSYRLSVERLSWEMDVRFLLKLFFGAREFKTPRGMSPEVLTQLDLPTDLYGEQHGESVPYSGREDDDFDGPDGEGKPTGTRCINTRPLVSAELPNRIARMTELFGKKGIVVMKSYAPLVGNTDPVTDQRRIHGCHENNNDGRTRHGTTGSFASEDREASTCSGDSDTVGDGTSVTYEELDRTFLDMTQAQLEEALYSTAKWYDNCRIRVKAVRLESKKAMRSEKNLNDVDSCMDATSMDTFLRTQLRVNIDNDRLGHIERCVRKKSDFAFCTHLPLRVKMMALVLATHTVKRQTADVATDFIRKEYRLERLGVVKFSVRTNSASDETGSGGRSEDTEEHRPDREWEVNWSKLLTKRKSLLTYCRSLADTHFPDSYFIGLHPDNAYDSLYNYMLGKTKYVTLQALRHQPWAKDICVALNYLLVMNAYDPELVELCLRLFLGFEWPGQWAKRIFVWKSNSNAGKSFFFEHIIRKAFDQSTCINDPKGGKDNAPEKSEYYKNFVLMINEFSSASAGELKKLCSTSSYKFRMNFGNQMIQAFMVGKMVFNCNTLPLTTDHATIQRVALVPLPFWFQKRQTIVDSMLNWTRGQFPLNEYERNFRRNISQMLVASERQLFIENRNTKNEDDLFNRPNDVTLRLPNEFSDQNTRASMFLVQNKTSQVYMLSAPPTGTIISGIVSITRYFCRFRFFNNIKEPVDYSVLPSACNNAAQEWQRISQPYFEWKERYQVHRDPNVRTKVSTIYAAINHFAKNRAKNVSFFDLKQFFEWDFAEHKIPYYNAKEDEYYVKIDPIQE